MFIRVSAACGVLLLLAGVCHAAAQTAVSDVCKSPTQAVHEKSFVDIGGIPQWVTIDGDKCSNPVPAIR
jgi:hypothetical protein